MGISFLHVASRLLEGVRASFPLVQEVLMAITGLYIHLWMTHCGQSKYQVLIGSGLGYVPHVRAWGYVPSQNM